MKKYGVSDVRERLSEVLDEAERGVAVFIERRGVRYRLSVEPGAPIRAPRWKSRIEVLDSKGIENGWAWDWAPGQLKFRRTRRS